MITVLYDNYRAQEGLRNAWGFSCLVEEYGTSVLFDTGGDGDILMSNLRALNVSPEKVDSLVLSHDHWDHTGGLECFLEHSRKLKVFLPRDFEDPTKDTVRKNGAELHETERITTIVPQITTTPVFHSPLVEQGLCVNGPGGTVLITGCAHPGIVHMVQVVKETTGSPVTTVLGGFHLKDDWNTSINRKVAELKDLGVARGGPSHCSGDAAREKMARSFGDDYLDVGLGSRIALEDLC